MKVNLMTETQNTTLNTADREILVTRTFDASRELVWKVWTDPKHITHWWGPIGFTTTTQGMDLRPDGAWRFVMHGPDGRDYINKINYIEVVKPERLVYKHAGDEETEPVRFHVTVTFEEENGKTKLTMRSVFESAAELKRVNDTYGAIEGAKQTIARLAEYLTKMTD